MDYARLLSSGDGDPNLGLYRELLLADAKLEADPVPREFLKRLGSTLADKATALRMLQLMPPPIGGDPGTYAWLLFHQLPDKTVAPDWIQVQKALAADFGRAGEEAAPAVSETHLALRVLTSFWNQRGLGRRPTWSQDPVICEKCCVFFPDAKWKPDHDRDHARL